MKIAVTDACIFIDLIELDLISGFFKLDLEIHTSVDVINELFLYQKQILYAFEASNKLTIHNLSENDFVAMDQIGFPRGLSQEDKTVIFLALKLENTILISSDKLVRDFAGKKQVEFHGMFWIFDQMVERKIINKNNAASSLRKLLTINLMYNGAKTIKEIEKRIGDWNEG